ncbi:hypothetical protein [Streptomyces sp. 3211.6]|uniref:hypothetical protein n=1 Tax=Streptomyces sp. 3211.6 TaxID=1938845 RepID=UPI000EAEAE34|nr:hypothetical protein [Streptomyces sp. 3211.6]
MFIELDGTWHPLPWNGLPPEGTVPAFGDARVGEVLKEAARSGLRPRTDTELLPVLLDLLAEVTPVEGWPGRPEARKRAAARARELARARAATADRPDDRPPTAPAARSAPRREVADAITTDRLRRRRAATGGARPVPAARLGDGLAARTLYPTARPEPHADLDKLERPDSDHAESIKHEGGTG